MTLLFKGQAHVGTFRVILADPPWQHAQYSQAGHGAAKAHYSEMPLSSIEAMPVGELAHPDGAMLFLWCTGPQAAEGAHERVAKAWGFRLTTRAFAWVKVNRACADCGEPWEEHKEAADPDGLRRMHPHGICAQGFRPSAFFGPGSYTGQGVEDVWLGVRGDTPWSSLRARKDIRQVVFAPVGRHSEKPEAVQDRIEAMWPNATPRLELFSRRRRPGGAWAHWGNEAPECDLVFGSEVGTTWPVPRVEAVADPQAALFAEGGVA